MSIDLSKLLTERRNANSANIDTLSTLEMLTVINQEDQQVAQGDNALSAADCRGGG